MNINNFNKKLENIREICKQLKPKSYAKHCSVIEKEERNFVFKPECIIKLWLENIKCILIYINNKNDHLLCLTIFLTIYL